MEFNKRSRTTNREQFSLMVERMKLNEEIARNMSRQSPEVVSVFWTTLGTDLNALGPPTKSISEWKKVWSDFKSSIKKKLTNNRSLMSATGGGPNTETPLTALEEEVAQLVSLADAIEGVRGRAYGIQQGLPRAVPPSEPSVSGAIPNESGQAGQSAEDVPAATTSQPQRRLPQRNSQMRLLKMQVEQQKKFHDNVSSSLRGHKRRMDDLTKNVKKMEKSISSLGNTAEKMCSSLQELVAETKRHNLASEKLLRDKTRLKKQLLQLELDKVNSTLSK